MKKLLITAMMVTAASSSFAINLYSNQSTNANIAALNYQSLTRSGVAAAPGTMWSEVQANGAGPQLESNTSAGASVAFNGTSTTAGFRLADDFTVGGNGWDVTGIAVFAYQTGAVANPFTGGNMNIWSGRPGDVGSTILFGASWTNATDQVQFTDTTFGVANRIFSTDSPAPGTVPGTTRRIWQNNFSLTQTLGAGTYWVDYQLVTANGSAFAPNTTHQNVRGVSGANARQFNLATGLWVDVLDTGNPAAAADIAQDMPFIISGTEAVPEPATMLVLAGLAAAAARRRKSSK